MKTLILPGLSPHNRIWAEEARSRLQLDQEVIIQEWQHWVLTQPGKAKDFSLAEEIGRLKKTVAADSFNVIAKSVGTVVFLELLNEIDPAQVGKVILCGLSSFTPRFSALRKLQPAQILCLQNSADPYGSFVRTARFLKDFVPEINIIEKPAATHDYPYYDEFQSFLTE